MYALRHLSGGVEVDDALDEVVTMQCLPTINAGSDNSADRLHASLTASGGFAIVRTSDSWVLYISPLLVHR